MAEKPETLAAESGAGTAGNGGRKRTRRTPAQVRSALTRAARAVFERRGYSGATTREIAKDAGVNEVLLFRHFSSKANLFAETVFEPFVALFDEFVDDEVSTVSLNERQRFIQRLVTLIKDNRELIMTVINAQAYEPDIGEIASLKVYFTESLERVRNNHMARDSGVDSETLGKLIRCGFAAVVGALLLEPWILSDMFEDEQERVALLSRFVESGMYGKPLD